jgi:DNA-binding beta-propeller fold protein YncE
VQLFKAPRSGADEGGLALSPDGKTAFVTGWGSGTASHPVVYETVAYATASGTQLWASSYAHGAAVSEAHSVAVSPDGKTVFVTGASDNAFEGSAFATVAYRASSGAQLWASRYQGKLPGFDYATQLAVSPDGTRLIVTGSSNFTPGAPQPADYTTVAYATKDGTRLWARRYAGFNKGTTVRAVAVSPDGSTVFVTGSMVYETLPGGGVSVFATVAYRF